MDSCVSLLLTFPFFFSEHRDRPKERDVLHHVEGHPRAVLHVRLLLQRPQPAGDPEGREAHGGAARTLCLQVCNLNKPPRPP